MTHLHTSKLVQTDTAVEGECSGAEGGDHQGHDGEGDGVLRCLVAVMEGDQKDGEEHVDGGKDGPEAGEQAEKKADTADELGDGGEVAEPCGHAERVDEGGVVVHGGERRCSVGGNNLAPTPIGEGEAKREAEEEGCGGLEAFKPLAHTDS